MEPAEGQGENFWGLIAVHNVQHMAKLAPTILQLLECQQISTKNYTVCDFGAADGGVSIDLMKGVIKKIRDMHGEDVEFSLVFEDIETSLFGNLFSLVEGALSAERGVHTLACGRGFFEQCLPRRSLHLGLSHNAMLYLSKLPCVLHNSVVHATQGTSAAEEEAFRQQAAADWRQILAMRAQELASGGITVISIMYMKGLFPEYHHMQILGNVIHDAVKEEIITQEEFTNINVAFYVHRFEEDIRAPFEDSASEVGKNLKVLKIWYTERPFPMEVEWRSKSDREPGEAREYGRRLADYVRKWSAGSVLQGLASTRTQHERTDIISRIYNNMATWIEANPYKIENTDHFINVAFQRVA